LCGYPHAKNQIDPFGRLATVQQHQFHIDTDRQTDTHTKLVG